MNHHNPVRQNYIYAGVLFLIWPFVAALAALKHYKKPWAKNVAWAFVGFFGFTFAIGAASQGNDIVRYVSEYQALYNVHFTWDKAVDYFQYSGEIDILRTLIAVVFSRFTDSQAVLTGVYGIIFGYFFTRNMWYVLERLEGRIKPYTLILFACFFLAVPIWNINGFRMWTAAHVFLFGILPYLFEGKKKGLLVASASVLVHFSFIVPVSLLIIHSIAGSWLSIYFGVYIFTFFISEIDLGMINRYVETYTPEIFQERTKYYRRESKMDAIAEQAAQRSWHIVWYGRALGWAVMGYLVVLYVKGKDFFADNKGWRDLFSFTLLFFSAANILSMLPSGSRYLTLARLIALALIVLYFQNIPQKRLSSAYKYIAFPALLLFILVSLRLGLLAVSATAILGNPLIAFFTAGDTVPMNDFLMALRRII